MFETEPPATKPMSVIDSFTLQGDSHSICQDYAETGRTGQDSGDAWAILSDGCSSAPHSDFGSRLLVRAAARNLDLLSLEDPTCAAERFHDVVIREAAVHAAALGLPSLSLTATLLTTRTHGNKVIVTAYGDGVVALRTRGEGQHWQVHAVSFEDGKAAYPSYRLDPATLAKFRGLPDNARQIDTFTLSEKGCDLPSPTSQEADFLLWILPREDFDTVALLSDGASSFTEIPAEGYDAPRDVPLPEVLPELLGFRLMTDGFARRRGHTFQKANKKRRWRHHDDLSVAALHLPDLSATE